MPQSFKPLRRSLCRHAIASACCVLLASGLLAASAEASSVTVGVNIYLGASPTRIGSDTQFLNAANWVFGPLGLPNSTMPVYFGPSQIIANGIPTGVFDLPASEAVLSSGFNAYSLDMRAWDGVSQLRLTAGALLNTNATIGGLNNTYLPTGAIQKATVVLEGGQLAGSWRFQEHSRVLVQGQYSQPQGSWSGTLDELVISPAASFAANAGGVAIGQIRNDGVLTLGASQTLSMNGSVINNGVIDVRGTGQQVAVLQLYSNTTLSGSGETVLGGRTNSFIGYIDNSSKTLTIAAGHTVRGSGMLGGGRYSQYFRDTIDVVNNGTVLVEGVDGMGVMMSNRFDNRVGVVQVADKSQLTLVGDAPLIGGTFQSLGAATLLGGGRFEGVTFRGGFNLAAARYINATMYDSNSIGSNQTASIGGSLVNNGTLTISGGGTSNAAGTLQLLSDTTLSGGGVTVLGGRTNSFIGNTDNSSKTLTIAAGHTVRGSGMLGGGRYSQYFRDTIDVVNNGTVLVEGVDGMGVMMSNRFDNRAGVVRVADKSQLTLVGDAPLIGGTFQSLGAATLLGGGRFEGVTFRGGFNLAAARYINATMYDSNSIGSNQTASIGGSFVNNGTLTISGGGTSNAAGTLQLLSDTTLSGGGVTVLGGRTNSFIGNTDNSSKTLTIAADHTVRGSGMLGGGRYSQYFRDSISVVNQGTIIVEGAGGMGAIGPSFVNQGFLQVARDSAFETSIESGIRQTTAGAVMQVDGTLAAQNVWLDAGTLKGSGLVRGNVFVTGGTVAPGNSPGKLGIQGNLTLGQNSVLQMEVAGMLPGSQYDWLDVTGKVTLDGTLRILFVGYTPQLGDSFSFITSGIGSFTGAFDWLETPGYTMSLQQGGQTLSLTVSGITPVPEPSTWALMLLGAVGLSTWLPRRRAACC